MLGFVLDISFSISLAAFVAMHAYLIATGRTTVESTFRDGSTPNAYNYGAAANAMLVLGASPLWWLWPYLTDDVRAATSDGVDFSCNSVGNLPRGQRRGRIENNRDVHWGDTAAATADVQHDEAAESELGLPSVTSDKDGERERDTLLEA